MHPANHSDSCGHATPEGWVDVVVASSLGLLTLAVYVRVLGHDFVWFDDNWYVRDNQVVRAGLTWSGAWLALTKSYAANWHPLTWLSHMLDVQLFGMDPRGHHATSLLLHAAATVLLYVALRSLTGSVGPSAFTAVLFAIHPLHVESVAWVAERKDVLCGFFWMATMVVYARYVKVPSWRNYGLVLGGCALCLMSKPMGVTLPLVLLLLDAWPLGRLRCERPVPGGEWGPALRRVLWEKVPLIALTALAGFLTWVAQSKGGAIASVERVPLGARAANAVLSYWAYLGKMLWPSSLSVFYPRREVALADGAVLLGAAALVAVTAVAWRLRARAPYCLVGWLWYLVTLLPVIGLVQAGEQAMADRYTYLPLVGPFMALSWGGAEAARRWPPARRFLPWLAGAICLSLSAATWCQAGHWRNTETLFAHALAVTERNWLAHNSYGVALLKRGRLEPAMDHFQESLAINPEHIEAHLNVALTLRTMGQPEEAVEAYRRALELAPGLAKAHHDLGVLFQELGRTAEAEAEYEAALQGRDDAVVRQRLALLLLSQERFAEAVPHLEEVVRRMPGLAEPRNSLGVALAELGRTEEAVRQFEEALRLQPDYREARLNLESLGVRFDPARRSGDR
jgi:Flp pilus assembly protein TadD